MSIARKQRKILERIYDCQKPSRSRPLVGILKTILEHSEEQAVLALKDYGIRLQSFARAIDLENPHPDLFNSFEGHLTSYANDSFNRTACDVLRLVTAADFKISLRVLDTLRNLVVQHSATRLLTMCLDGPRHNQMNVRFVKSPEERDRIRSTKKVQTIGLGGLYGNGIAYWDSAPSNFDSLWRNSNRFERDIKYAKDRQTYFEGFGLEEMSQAIGKSVQEMESEADKYRYYGFNRIDLTNASVILAKEAGYEFGIDCPYSSSGNGSYAYATGASFGDYEFACEEILHAEGKVEYRPRLYIYPSEAVLAASDVTEEPVLPSRMKELFEFLEAFPETGGHPLFDHYRILVPGLDYPNTYQDKPAFRKVSGEVVEFRNWEAAQYDFDRYLVENGHVPAVLLGERDGDHYFISYWC